MVARRFHLSGLIAVLFALMAQLGAGAAVPSVDPVLAAAVLCHPDDNGSAPAHRPTHPPDCLVCPLCATLHGQQAMLTAEAPRLIPPPVLVFKRVELPPPSRAPPLLHRPPSQPRAPPTLS